MANGINLILIKGDKGYDISELVSEIKWSGRKGSSARSIDVTLIDDEDRSQRAGIDVTKGHQCIFSYDGKELFRGIIMQVKQADTKKCTFKAYDNGIYLANNKDTFKYTDKTVEQIFKDICSRFGIPYSKADSSNFKIPELTKSKTTAWDALCDAMSQVYSSTGVRHYIDSDKGSLRLQKRQDNIKQWVLETGANIITYSNTVSIEKVKTRIKAVSSEGNTVAEKKDTTLEKTIGIMQEIASLRNLLNLNIQTLYATGTYTGTGAYGSASPNSLTFAHAPKFLIVMPETGTDARYEGFMALAGVTNLYTGGIANDVANTRSQIRFTWNGTTVSWYNTTSAADQQNTNGATYRYFALY